MFSCFYKFIIQIQQIFLNHIDTNSNKLKFKNNN